MVAHGSGENADRLADMTSENSLQHKRVRKSPGERRQEILDAAVRLISERGYNGTSVQDVADAVGVTKQGVLRYFPSKDNLLAAVYHENYNTFAVSYTHLTLWKTSWPPACLVQGPMISDCPHI